MNIKLSIPTRSIPGLSNFPGCINRDAEQVLLQEIDGQVWSNDLKRRVQHYGYRYDYAARDVSAASWLGELPTWLSGCARALADQGFFSRAPDQVIINEYLPGQGIAPHIDRTTCFDGTIAILSLGSGITMDFLKEGAVETQSHRLQPRSLTILQGEARYRWRHGIAPRKADMVDDVKILRERRVSVTFRKVLLGAR
jgi:alkylated DNA repair dioxygenase AlkB